MIYILKATLANKDAQVKAGDAALYTVDVTVPNGWVNLDVEFEGGENFPAANLRVVSSKC